MNVLLRSRTGMTALAFGAIWLVAYLLMLASYGDAGVIGHAESIRTLGLVGIIATSIAWVWERAQVGGHDLFAPELGFPAAYLTWFALGSMNLVKPMPGTTLWDPVPFSILIYALLGLAAYYSGGWFASPGRAQSIDRARVRAEIRTWIPDRVRMVTIALGAVMLLAYAALISRIGIPILSGELATARLAFSRHAALFSVFNCGVLTFTPLSLAWLWSEPHRRISERLSVYGANGLLLIMLFALANRGLVIEPVLLGLLTAHYVRAPISARTLIVAAVFGSMFLSVMGLWRDLQEYGPAHLLTVQSWGMPWWSLPFTYIYTYVRDPVVTFSLSTEVIPRFVDYQHGAIALSPLIAPLPGHQESYDLFFKRILHNDFVGMGRPATLLGSLYADFGIVGILLGMSSFGALSCWVYRKTRETARSFPLVMHIWIVHTALLSLFSSLIPYITTLFVPLLIYGATSMMTRPDQRRSIA